MAPKTDVIEQLRTRIAELEEENARLKRTNSSYASLTKAKESQLTNLRQRLYQLKGADSAIDSERQANCDLTEQLAAEQLNNKLLRDALEQIACGYEMGSAVSGVGENVIRLRFVSQEQMEKAFDSLTLLIDEAGNPSPNTPALDAYVAEKVKGAMK